MPAKKYLWRDERGRYAYPAVSRLRRAVLFAGEVERVFSPTECSRWTGCSAIYARAYLTRLGNEGVLLRLGQELWQAGERYQEWAAAAVYTRPKSCSEEDEEDCDLKGLQVRRWREAAGLSLRELARRLGVSPGWLCRVERGLRRLKPAQQAQVLVICAVDEA